MTDERLDYLAMLDDQSIPLINVVAHRGFSKTTLGIIFCIRQISMRLSSFLLYTSSEQKIALRRTEAIRAFFVGADCRRVFGDLRPVRNQKITASFSEDAFYLIDPDTQQPVSCISPRGSGQTVNGSIAVLGTNMAQRVDLLVNDDGQNRRHIENPTVRETYESWLEAEYFQTVDPSHQPVKVRGKLRWPDLPSTQRAPWRAVLGDSCKHRMGASMKFLKRKAWENRVYPLFEHLSDGNVKLRHKVMTQEQLEALVERNKHKPDYLAREYECKPKSPLNQCYASDMFQHEDTAETLKNRRGLFSFGVVDPSKSGNTDSCPVSILAVKVDVLKGKIYFVKNVVDIMSPEEYYQRVFDVAIETGIVKWWVEDSGLNDVLRNGFKQAASIRGIAGEIDFDWLTSQRHPGVEYGQGKNAIKVARAKAPLPFYKQGQIVHDISLEDGVLETELLNWPDCTEWDATDTAGYVPEILEKEEIYFDSQAEEIPTIDMDTSAEYEEAARFFERSNWFRRVA
jgi:hypothetical protein